MLAVGICLATASLSQINSVIMIRTVRLTVNRHTPDTYRHTQYEVGVQKLRMATCFDSYVTQSYLFAESDGIVFCSGNHSESIMDAIHKKVYVWPITSFLEQKTAVRVAYVTLQTPATTLQTVDR